jgi:hypothetical protein
VWRNNVWLISADVALIKLIDKHNRAKTVVENYHHSATYTVSQSSPVTTYQATLPHRRPAFCISCSDYGPMNATVVTVCISGSLLRLLAKPR